MVQITKNEQEHTQHE